MKNLLIVLLLCFCTSATLAQNDKLFKTTTITLDKDAAFDKVIDYLTTKDIFIQSLDKQAGFIQGKVFIKNGSLLSTKAGEKRTMNFFLKQVGNQTQVTLNIYMEQYYFGGNSSSRSYYFEDKGIITDASVYREVLSSLQKAIDH
ncbi:hypothetical protein MUGA111182_08755 [Mucilaginibacter galii]|nr:hypothetical protein [Mucilaginibacter galii]